MSELLFLIGLFFTCVLIYECMKMLIKALFWCTITFMCWYLGKVSTYTKSFLDVKFEELDELTRTSKL